MEERLKRQGNQADKLLPEVYMHLKELTLENLLF